MKDTPANIKSQQNESKSWAKPYKKLRKHLDKMPVGFPSTFSGVELRLLRRFFTVSETGIALSLTYKPEPFETVYSRVDSRKLSEEELRRKLRDMDGKGAIMAQEIDGATHYSLIPFIYGMFETMGSRLTPSLYADVYQYLSKGFALDFVSSNPSQVRVIPIEKSIEAKQKLAAYDEIREVILKSEGRIGVTECICKNSKDLLNDACKVTARREICLVFREGHDLFTRHGWARSIPAADALDLIDQAEKDGLVLMVGNEEEINFLCCCCHCCCGFVQIFSSVPGPSEFVVSNYRAEHDVEACKGCGICEKRCQFDAIAIVEKKAVLKKKRCVGCGLCVSTCKTEAIRLSKKATETTPPKTVDDMYSAIMENKRSRLIRYPKTIYKIMRSGKE
ncbi:MAG: 4Fe-4S ferredoxin [Proteobacteria bacterium]|nr:4Fe-4S ferredoxin [Pseudomonadota bacterium]